MSEKRYQVVFEDHQEIVRDTKYHLNIMFLASSGMGVHADTRKYAEAACELFNEKFADVIPYPYRKG